MTYDACFQFTFLHDAPPLLGPVTELQSVTLLDLCSLLETADQLITQPVTVVYPLHCSFIVSRLQMKTKRTDSAESHTGTHMQTDLVLIFKNLFDIRQSVDSLNVTTVLFLVRQMLACQPGRMFGRLVKIYLTLK